MGLCLPRRHPQSLRGRERYYGLLLVGRLVGQRQGNYALRAYDREQMSNILGRLGRSLSELLRRKQRRVGWGIEAPPLIYRRCLEEVEGFSEVSVLG